MKAQWKILLVFSAINLSFGMVMALQLPGTEYVHPTNATGTYGDYESRFNATEIAEQWNPPSDLWTQFTDTIFSPIKFVNTIRFLIDGLGVFMDWISSLVVDPTARTSLLLITNVFRGIYYVAMGMVVIEFVSGRYTD